MTPQSALSLASLMACLCLLTARPAGAQDDPPENPPEDTADDPDAPAAERILDVVTIVGRREDAGRISGSAHVVDDAQLETFERDDIHRVLARIPGVYTRGEDGYGLRPNIGLRGASSDRSSKVTLMQDGVLLGPAPYAAPAAYYFPLVTRVTAVEVFKGPASIANGPNTIGGAINLVTRDIPWQPGGAIDLSIGRFDTHKTHAWAGGTHEGFGAVIEGVRLSTDGFKTLDGGGDTGFDKKEATLKLGWSSDPGGDLWHAVRLELGYADELSNETYLGLTDADFDAAPYRRYAGSRRDRMRWTRTALRLDYTLGIGSDVDLAFTAYRHDFERSWFKLNRFRGAELRDVLQNPDDGQLAVYLAVLRGELDSEGRGQTLLVGDNARTFVSQGVQGRLTWRLDGDLVSQRIEAGVRLHADAIERDHTEDGFLMRSGRLVPDGLDRATTVKNRGSAEALAVHLIDEIRVGETLYLTPGGRLELIRARLEDRLAETPDETERTDTVLLGGLGAYYAFTPWLGALAGVHQGFSPVAPGQPTAVEPERSINYEAGVRLTPGPALRAELIGFFNDYSNLTAQCTISSGCDPAELNRQFSAGAVDVYGLEALARYETALGLGDLALAAELSYTLTRSAFREGFTSTHPTFGEVEAGDALAYVPEHQGLVGLALTHSRFGLATELSYVGEMRDIAGAGPIPAGERIPAHVVWDAAAYYRPGDAGRIYLKAENLLDSAYAVARRPYGLRPGMPFNLTLGYSHRFGSAR